ncbi:PAS domain S-box protein [bacterium]|nr:PAS domain S-box protein [bacterium]
MKTPMSVSSQERIIFQNRLLRGIFHIQKLMFSGANRESFLSEACGILLQTDAFSKSCFILLDDSMRYQLFTGEGLHNDMEVILQSFRKDGLPDCVGKAVESKRLVIIKNPADECKNSIFTEILAGYQVCLIPLITNGKVSGVFCAGGERKVIIRKDELELLEQLGEVLSTGLLMMDEKGQLSCQESSLREAESRFQALFGNAPVGIGIATHDGDIIAANDKAFELFGYSREDLDKINLKRLYKFPQDRDKLLAVLYHEHSVHDYEIQFKRKDGFIFWASLTIIPILYNGDEVLLTAVVDVTEKKEKLKESIIFKAIEDNAAYGSAIGDMDGVLIYVNKAFAKMHGYSVDEMQGKTFFDFYPQENLPLIRKKLAVLKRDGAHSGLEVMSQKKDGTPLPLIINTTVLYDSQQKPAYFATSCVDISKRIEIHKKLEEKEQNLKALLDATTDSVFLLNSDKKIIALNKQAAESLGKSEDELIGKDGLGLIDAKTESERLKRISKVMETGTPSRFEDSRNGVHYIINMFPVFDNSGNVSGAAIYARDITARKNLELQVEEYAKTLKAMLDSMQETAILLEKDGKIIIINKIGAQRIGYNEEELIGRNIYDCIPEDVAETRKIFVETVIRTKTPSGFKDEREDYLFEHFLYPVFDENGEVIRIAIFSRDITQKSKSELALIDSENRFSDTADRLPEGIYEINLLGEFTYANKKALELIGYSEEDMKKRIKLSYIFVPEDQKRLQKNLKKIHKGIDIGPQEYHAVKKDGSIFPVQVHSAPIYQGNKLIGVRGIAMDITGRKEYEKSVNELLKELEISNQDLENFAYSISHDLKEPLRMVHSYLGLLKKRYHSKLDRDARDFIDFACSGSQMMTEMIDNLLDFSRIGTNKEVLQRVDTDKVLKRALDNLQVPIRESKAKISFDKLPIVIANEDQMLRLFQNLIGNALKYRSDKQPAIHISAVRTKGESIKLPGHRKGFLQGSWWLFSFKDNGIGIHPKHRETIFQLFRQLHPRDKYPGTGMGLAICKRITDRHGGYIWVDSKPGDGSIFHVALPAIKKTEK